MGIHKRPNPGMVVKHPRHVCTQLAMLTPYSWGCQITQIYTCRGLRQIGSQSDRILLPPASQCLLHSVYEWIFFISLRRSGRANYILVWSVYGLTLSLTVQLSLYRGTGKERRNVPRGSQQTSISQNKEAQSDRLSRALSIRCPNTRGNPVIDIDGPTGSCRLSTGSKRLNIR
ncbi:hypothetical protein BDQ12DRAFT_502877 [Crucibulum laeve]|uniref:Uncharacterized protein n=1 Tax=Crucibulum laeve TaxID=68775 RepID=A0A5C3LH31_9AGAR|nr:hypothetical protein BDQ12DRAFT_502877 [Crucibulum laeve]